MALRTSTGASETACQCARDDLALHEFSGIGAQRCGNHPAEMSHDIGRISHGYGEIRMIWVTAKVLKSPEWLSQG
jgi:hypothetical protein